MWLLNTFSDETSLTWIFFNTDSETEQSADDIHAELVEDEDEEVKE